MSAETPDAFEEYAKVELMGHSVLVARVTKAPIGDFIRCDVLNDEGGIEQTKLISPKAVYAISLLTRDAALQLAKHYGVPPVARLAVPTPTLPAPANPDDDDLPESWNGDGR